MQHCCPLCHLQACSPSLPPCKTSSQITEEFKNNQTKGQLNPVSNGGQMLLNTLLKISVSSNPIQQFNNLFKIILFYYLSRDEHQYKDFGGPEAKTCTGPCLATPACPEDSASSLPLVLRVQELTCCCTPRLCSHSGKCHNIFYVPHFFLQEERMWNSEKWRAWSESVGWDWSKSQNTFLLSHHSV